MADLAHVERFQSQLGSNVRVDALELRIPTFFGEHEMRFLGKFLLTQEAWLRAHLFCEFELTNDWECRLALFREIIPEAFGNRVGFKIRCGGTDPQAFPSTETLARFLAFCQRRGVHWKATAGLHHPFPTWVHTLEVTMHGFINLFGSGVLGAFHGWNEAMYQKAFTDAEPTHWQFSNDGLTWNGFSVTCSQINAARQHVGVAFGSCSIDEPVGDLKNLGWI
jgi:hypothetical protein